MSYAGYNSSPQKGSKTVFLRQFLFSISIFPAVNTFLMHLIKMYYYQFYPRIVTTCGLIIN